MNLADAAEELYGADPEEFVTRRSDLVKRARAAQDRDLAAAIGGLRRPTRSAWLVNLLARRAEAELAGLLDLGAALREASSRLDGAELRRLSTERSRAVQALTARAAHLGAEHGHPASEAARAEVGQTLTAALADPELAELVRAGRIAVAVAYGGFGPVDLTEAAARSLPAREGADRDRAGREEADRDRAAHERAVAEAEQGLAAAETELIEARAEADQATARADALAEEIDAVRERLQEVEAAAREAHDAARAARKRVSQLGQVATRARSNLDAVRAGSG